MSPNEKSKGNKKLIIIAAGVVVIVVAVIVFVLPNLGQQEQTQPEVVAKRVKIDVKPQATTPTPQAAPNGAGAKPGETKQPAAAAPAMTAKPAETKKPAVAAAPATQAQKPVEAAKAAPPVKEPEATAKKETKKIDVSKKPWAVNLSSFIADSEANALKKKLKASGYRAYVSTYKKDDMTWYRVRVGFYRTKAEAQAAGKKIAAKFKIDHEPWILKASKTELAKYAK